MSGSIPLNGLSADVVLSRLKLRHLNLLVEIAARGSIMHAAAALNVAQPAATRIVRALEAGLRQRLFRRVSRGVIPTLYGEVVIRRAKRIIGEVRHTSEELEALGEGLSGHIAIGTLLAAAPSLLPHSIIALKRDRPGITVSLVEETDEQLMPMLRLGDLDLVVGRLSERGPGEGLAQKPLYSEPISIMVRRDHPLAAQTKVNLADLQTQQWIMPPPETLLRHQIELCFRKAHLDVPERAVESISILANFSILKTTDMVAALPHGVIETESELVRLPIDFSIGSGAIGVTWRLDAEHSPAVSYFLDVLERVAKQRWGTSQCEVA